MKKIDWTFDEEEEAVINNNIEIGKEFKWVRGGNIYRITKVTYNVYYGNKFRNDYMSKSVFRKLLQLGKIWFIG